MKRLLPLLVLAVSCGRPADPAPSDVGAIGGPGSGAGWFATPRAAAWDPRGFLYVIDKTARIQKFDAAGKLLAGWTTPAWDNGRPTGLAVDSRGDLLVADTHYHRILRYSSEGELRAQFGSEGRGPGEFIYPTGVVSLPDGTIYVSEYGGNDRVQAFTAEGKYLRGWGRYGEAAGEFKRPQGLAASGDRVYVADAANHRVQIFSLDGKPIAAWNDLRYPYSVALDSRGDVYVAQYGRHCVSKFRPDGTPIASAGHAGSGPEELDTPWAAVPIDRGRIAVVDAGNHRIQLWPSRLFGGSP